VVGGKKNYFATHSSNCGMVLGKVSHVPSVFQQNMYCTECQWFWCTEKTFLL